MFYYVQLGQTTAVDENKIMMYGILLHAFMPSYYDFRVFYIFDFFAVSNQSLFYSVYMYMYVCVEQREQFQIKSEA